MIGGLLRLESFQQMAQRFDWLGAAAHWEWHAHHHGGNHAAILETRGSQSHEERRREDQPDVSEDPEYEIDPPTGSRCLRGGRVLVVTSLKSHWNVPRVVVAANRERRIDGSHFGSGCASCFSRLKKNMMCSL